MDARTDVHAIAGVITHLFWRDIAQSIIQPLNPQFGPLQALRQAQPQVSTIVAHQTRVVNLQQKSRLHDALILFTHGIGDGAEIGFLRGVVFVPSRAREAGGMGPTAAGAPGAL